MGVSQQNMSTGHLLQVFSNQSVGKINWFLRTFFVLNIMLALKMYFIYINAIFKLLQKKDLSYL